MIAEVADLLLRHESAHWSLCWGYSDGRALLSVRTIDPGPPAGTVARRIVARKGTGGGHSAMAGGQIPLRGTTARYRQSLSRLILRRYLMATGNDQAACQRLI
jgi:nanoRNase/pAp phosphatase (c-di-AMP/oligoRNAs hydrolase)